MKAEAFDWLLQDSNPAVKLHALTDVVGRAPDDKEVVATRERVLSFGPVRLLKRAQGGRGYWPPDDECYNPKFTSTVWQLMLLGELGVSRVPWVETAAERFLSQHQMEDGALCCPRIGSEPKIDGEPCLTGNMIRSLLVFGYGDDPRIQKSLDWLTESQLDDGGWNCDYPASNPKHSSFMSTIEPLWAYSEFPKTKWTRRLKKSAEQGAEFLLDHRLYKSHNDWRTVELRGMDKIYDGNLVTKFHFPMYYYYDALHALRVLTKLGYHDDERIRDAVHLMISKKTPQGRWLLDGDWVRERNDKARKTLVTLERLNEPSKWITLNCYRVLALTGDLGL